MNLAKDTKVHVFQAEICDYRRNTVQANLSSYEGEYNKKPIYSSWRGFFVGDALKRAKKLEDGAHIMLTNAKISNKYDKENKRLYVEVTVFDFEEIEKE